MNHDLSSSGAKPSIGARGVVEARIIFLMALSIALSLLLGPVMPSSSSKPSPISTAPLFPLHPRLPTMISFGISNSCL